MDDENNMKTASLSLLAAALLTIAAGASAAESVYTWKNGKGSTSYSDVPQGLKPGKSSTMNIRTHSVSRPAAQENEAELTPEERQAKANEQILAKNKQIEEQNKKIEEENRRNKEDNCRIARLNHQSAQSARVANRAQLVNNYQNDINKYCN